MAQIVLDRLCIHDPDNPADHLALVLDELHETASKIGEVRVYAGGRRRVVRRSHRHGRPGIVTIRCEQVDRAAIAQLEEWCGRRLMFREPRGRVWWGVFWEVDIEEVPAQDEELADVGFAVERVSGTAEV